MTSTGWSSKGFRLHVSGPTARRPGRSRTLSRTSVWSTDPWDEKDWSPSNTSGRAWRWWLRLTYRPRKKPSRPRARRYCAEVEQLVLRRDPPGRRLSILRGETLFGFEVVEQPSVDGVILYAVGIR